MGGEGQEVIVCPLCRIDTLLQVASSFSTEPSVDVVLSSIPARIFEAVGYLQDSMDTFTAKVQH